MLTNVDWDSAFETGIPEIDQEHQAMFAQFNTLLQQINTEQSSHELAILFQKIIDDTAEHFLYEESIMKEMQYPLIDSHTDIHRKLLQDAHEVVMDIERSHTEFDPTPYINCLRALVIDHIVVHDSKILAYCRAQT